MTYIKYYDSPLGRILLTADDIGLTGLYMEGQRYMPSLREAGQKHMPVDFDGVSKNRNLPVFRQTKEWLDIYFSGKEPDFSVPLHYQGTEFRRQVWDILCTIPYGETVTYGDIAKQLAAKKGIAKMSAQAVGGAVGHNDISIIVPCHRVVGAGGNLTGYGGGIDKKIKLLELEHVDMSRFFVPKKGTA